MVEKILDSYSETNQDADASIRIQHPSAGALQSAIGQVVTSKQAMLERYDFYLKKVGNPLGFLRAGLYLESGGKPTGAQLATASQINMTSLLVAYALRSFVFTTPYRLRAHTNYCIAVYAEIVTFMDATNYIHVGYDTSAPTHAGNLFLYANGTWTASAPNDTCFYMYGRHITHLQGQNPLARLFFVPCFSRA